MMYETLFHKLETMRPEIFSLWASQRVNREEVKELCTRIDWREGFTYLRGDREYAEKTAYEPVQRFLRRQRCSGCGSYPSETCVCGGVEVYGDNE